MLKGKTVIELTDVRTGRKELREDENLVTEAVADILSVNVQGAMYDNTSFNGANGDAWLLPIYKNLTGGVLLYQNEIEEDAATIYAPLDNPLVGYASNNVNNTTDTLRGSRNLTESEEIDGGFKYVWDFATSQGNGTISAVCLTNVLAGRGNVSGSNYFVEIKSHSVSLTANKSNYQDNHRSYVEEGYRLECIVRYNSMTATIRKVPEDYLHARLMENPFSLCATEAEEETAVNLGHYPYWIHYVGGSSDGTDESANTTSTVFCYLFHAADGNWYGLSRKETKTYGSKSYSHTCYEWFLDTISDGVCTSRSAALPDETSSISTIGMSGKWLMFAIGTAVYRLDTATPANVEAVTGVTYNSSYQYTFSIDDDVVINGWYFKDGKPKLYVGGQAELSSSTYSTTTVACWGKRCVSRYKTFAYQEYYRGSTLYKELYLYTPYLATINNLAAPVVKTADQTMKITYTLTETEP